MTQVIVPMVISCIQLSPQEEMHSAGPRAVEINFKRRLVTGMDTLVQSFVLISTQDS
jgi:hypothetical protein